ncbi:hypothetical protein [Rhodococcus sp. NPDC059234]|uniref:hypothetical protein n=1 Tax=Rhodococcus sp. NPDC059234 TaxID=3346781 RepID=UPI00366AD1DE
MANTARGVMIEAAARETYEGAAVDASTWLDWGGLGAGQEVWHEAAITVVEAILAALPIECRCILIADSRQLIPSLGAERSAA